MIVKSEGDIKISITNAENISIILSDILKAEHEFDQDKEHFWAIGLNGANQIKYIDLVFLGALTHCTADPRETFRLAVLKSVNALIIAHNHPSAALTPSDCDLTTTRRMVMAGEVLGIKVIDHIIINGSGEYFSFLNKGMI